MDEKRIIWQPELFVRECGFKISLDRDFAREMVNSPLDKKHQKRTSELAKKDLKKMGIDWPDPYNFYKNTCFLREIHLGNNGVWLATSSDEASGLLREEKGENGRNIEYDAHNVDTPRYAYALMFLFHKWIDYSQTFQELDEQNL